MGLRGALRAVLAGALACLLSACWMSEKPLVTDRNAAAISAVGTYRGENDGDTIDLIIGPGGTTYGMTDGKDRVPTRFLALGRDWYLMQWRGESDGEKGKDMFYLYQPARLVAGEFHIYDADCETTEGAFKGMTRDGRTCEFTRADGLKDAALAHVARIEQGDLPGDFQVFKKVGR